MNIDWDQVGTLRNKVWDCESRTDPLWILVITAMQGHEGDLKDMEIELPDGSLLGPEKIKALALRSDRKWEE